MQTKSHTIRTIYKEYSKEAKDEISSRVFSDICSEFNLAIMEEILDGYEFNMQNNLGTISIRRVERDPRIPQINWGETSKYKQELLDKGEQLFDSATGDGVKWHIYYVDKLNRYNEPYDDGKTAAQARQATRPPGYPPFPITQQHILDAELQLKRIRMGYTQYRDHIDKSNALVAAEADYENLKRQFDLQEQQYPGAHLYPPYNTDRVYAISAPPLTPSQMSQYDRGDRGDRRRSGGKSKRVKRTKTCKSKRSNRSKTCKNRVHKRRN